MPVGKCLIEGKKTLDIIENLYEAQGDLLDGERDSAAGSLDTAYIRTKQAPLSKGTRKDIILEIKDIRESTGDGDIDRLVKRIKKLRKRVAEIAFENYYSCRSRE